MSKKKRKATKSGPVWHLSAEEATMLRKPRYNGFACGTGKHGDTKYNRAREKRAWKKDLRNGGPSLISARDLEISVRFLRLSRDFRVPRQYATCGFAVLILEKPKKPAPNSLLNRKKRTEISESPTRQALCRVSHDEMLPVLAG